MDMIWHYHISIDFNSKMWGQIIDYSINNFAYRGQSYYGRFMNRPYGGVLVVLYFR